MKKKSGVKQPLAANPVKMSRAFLSLPCDVLPMDLVRCDGTAFDAQDEAILIEVFKNAFLALSSPFIHVRSLSLFLTGMLRKQIKSPFSMGKNPALSLSLGFSIMCAVPLPPSLGALPTDFISIVAGHWACARPAPFPAGLPTGFP